MYTIEYNAALFCAICFQSAAIHNLGLEFQIYNILSQVCESVIIQMT